MSKTKEKLKKVHSYLKQRRQEVTRLEVEDTMPSVAPKSKLRKNLSAITGLFILFLAILGIVLSGVFVYHLHSHKEEQQYQEKLAYYQGFIEPVVLFDTGEFVDTNNANNLSLLIPAFFKAQQTVYATTNQRETITATDISATRYIVRAQDVNTAAQQLFGKTVIPQTFTLDGLLFEYVENEKYFLSPISLHIEMYTPNVTAITPTKKGVDLRVEYLEFAGTEQCKVKKTMNVSLAGEYKKEIIMAVTAAK